MNFGLSANLSPYTVLQAAAALTGGAFTAVALGENGVATSAVGDIPVGILTAEMELPIAAGDDVNAQIYGNARWQVGAAVKMGDLLAAGADGKAKVAESGEYIFARAFEAGAAGEVIHVQILQAGVKA